MRKLILFLSVCALVPMVTIAVARAEDDELTEEEYQEEEEYSEESETTDDATDVNNDTEDVDDVAGDADTETRGVTKRITSCADIKQEMERLNALEEQTDADLEQLYRFQSSYRAKCVKKAKGRIKGAAQAVDTHTAADLAVDFGGATSCTTPDDNGCCPGEKYVHLANQGFVCCTANNDRCFPPMETSKTKAKKPVTACDDGSKPDKNGCCKGEKYTDLGAQGFNCCKSDGVTCFPPIK